jgi:hypothetical protein
MSAVMRIRMMSTHNDHLPLVVHGGNRGFIPNLPEPGVILATEVLDTLLDFGSVAEFTLVLEVRADDFESAFADLVAPI